MGDPTFVGTFAFGLEYEAKLFELLLKLKLVQFETPLEYNLTADEVSRRVLYQLPTK
jgi:hypothetical protein